MDLSEFLSRKSWHESQRGIKMTTGKFLIEMLKREKEKGMQIWEIGMNNVVNSMTRN